MGESKTPVWLFIPNLIGYARVVFGIWAFYYSFTDYQCFFFMYGLSAALDMADGYAARYFDQCSRFGAVLDQVTDRASTASLLMVLSQFYPDYLLGFVFLNALDLVSHFARLTSQYVTAKKSHKDGSANHPWILNIYYNSRAVLCILCAGNELFYCLLYLFYFTPGPEFGGVEVAKYAFYVSVPIWALKQVLNGIQLWCAMKDIADIDEMDRKRK